MIVRPVREAAAALLLLLAVSCAPVAATTPVPVPGATPPRAGGSAAPPVAAAIDSTPSPEAAAVLRTIPEPIAPGEAVAAPPVEPADSAAIDTLGSAAEPDTVGGDVPVPSPTYALGQTPPAADSVSATPDGTPSQVVEPAPPPETAPANPAPPPPSSPPGGAPPAAADTCWRVQVGAPADRAKANALERAAASQLLVEMVVEPEKRLYKVRTRGCWDRATADQVRRRAIASGFGGAFLFPRKLP